MVHACFHKLPPAQDWSCPDPLQSWLDTEMLVGFPLLLYLHLLFYSISADKNKPVLGEAA